MTQKKQNIPRLNPWIKNHESFSLGTRIRQFRKFCSPCHFCGMPVTIQWENQRGYYVHCTPCGASGPGDRDIWNCVERWNRFGPEANLREFHETFGHEVNDEPASVPTSVLQLRLKLIGEEYAELVEAIMSGDHIKIAKEAADLVYVVVGTCVSYGLPFGEIFRAVHSSNMSKAADATYRQDGKVIKGNAYKPPDIQKILDGSRIAATKKREWIGE